MRFCTFAINPRVPLSPFSSTKRGQEEAMHDPNSLASSLRQAETRILVDQRGQFSLKNLLTKRECAIIIVICLILAAVIRLPDTVSFHLSWSERIDPFTYTNGEFPVWGEKVPPPIVGDIDGDRVTDVVLQMAEKKLQMLTWPASRSPIKPHTHSPVIKAEVELPLESDGAAFPPRVIAMVAGYLQKAKPGLPRYQNIVVLASDWTVYCLSPTLKVKWSKKVASTLADDMMIREPSILVSHHPIQAGDVGSIVIGGRPTLIDYHLNAQKRLKRGKPIEPGKEAEEKDKEPVFDHYSTYALDGSTGDLRWKHEPGDFEVEPAYYLDSGFRHFKLDDHSQRLHSGELSWQQFKTSFGTVMPHSWTWDEDTFSELAHFKRDKRKEQEGIGDQLVAASTSAREHLRDAALGQSVLSPLGEDDPPNVVVIHTSKGIEVLHFYQGRPLCTLLLSSYHATHADIDGDKTIEHVHAVVQAEEGQGEEQEEEEELGTDCYGQAVRSTGKVVFHHSICKPMHWLEAFVAIEEYLPGMGALDRKETRTHLTEPMAPVLLPSSVRTRFNLHVVKTTRVLDKIEGQLYDSVFALSTGRITSIGPHGEFNWQTDTIADWDTASKMLHGKGLTGKEFDVFMLYSFTPSLQGYSYKVGGAPTYVLLMGWSSTALVSSYDGDTATQIDLPFPPVMAPKIADFSGDGHNDIILICRQGYYGYTVQRVSGFLHSSLLCVLLGVGIMALGVFLRRHSVLPPPVKED